MRPLAPFAPRAAVVLALAVPFFAACARDSQQRAAQPQQQPVYTATAQQPAHTATAQPTAYATAQPTAAATTTAAAAPTFPFGFQIPTNLPAMIPSGLIPGFPAAAPTTT
jgi:hypothetical protein